MPHARSRRGFSLIESAIVLGIIGLIIGGIWVAAAAVMENMKLTNTLTLITGIVQNYKKTYHNLPLPADGFYYCVSNNPNLAIEMDWLTTANGVDAAVDNNCWDGWNNNIHLTQATVNGKPCISIDWYNGGVSNKACTILVTKISTLMPRSDLADSSAWFPDTSTYVSLPIPPDQAAAACASSGNSNRMGFCFAY